MECAQKIPAPFWCAECDAELRLGLVRPQRYFLRFAPGARRFAGAISGATGAGGLSPSTPFSGQILKAGHFWQPATMAIGQTVMADSVGIVARTRSMAPAARRR